MTITLPQLKGADLLTNSRMSCLKTCPRKHYYSYELGIRKEYAATALRFGAAFHVGLDLHAKGDPDAALKAVQDYESLPPWATTDEAVVEWMVERETVYRMLLGYFWFYADAQLLPEQTVAEVIASEIAFELPIRNPETGSKTNSFKVAGKIDKIVRLGDGRLAVMEHKTTGDSIEVNSDYWKRLRIDQQISLYILAAREMGYSVETVLYDVARKPSIRPKKITKADAKSINESHEYYRETVIGEIKDGDVESPCMYGARFLQDIGERPSFYFARQEIPRLDSDLEEFRQELWDQQQQLRETQKNQRWFRNTSACLTMGRCVYLDMCPNGLEIQNLPSGFTRVSDVHPELACE